MATSRQSHDCREAGAWKPGSSPLTQKQPPDGSTHWTTRKLARALGGEPHASSPSLVSSRAQAASPRPLTTTSNLHFTPTYSRWLNRVELAEQIERGTLSGVGDGGHFAANGRGIGAEPRVASVIGGRDKLNAKPGAWTS